MEKDSKMEMITRIDKDILTKNFETYSKLMAKMTKEVLDNTPYEMQDKITPSLISSHVLRVWETSKVNAYLQEAEIKGASND